MKKLNITKEAFEKSNYFKNKYGELEYVSESGKVYKTDKGKILMFKESTKRFGKKFLKESGEPVSIIRRCPVCGKDNELSITEDQWKRFQKGGVMEVLDLDADTREMLKTGICPKCWDDMFA